MARKGKLQLACAGPSPGSPRRTLGGARRDLAQDLWDDMQEVESRSGRTYYELFRKALIVKACNGSDPHMKALADRVWGKVPDRIAGSDGGPVQVEVAREALLLVYGEREAAGAIEATYRGSAS